MLDKAMQLCSAAFGILWTYDGELLHPVAHRGVPPAYAEFLTTERHLSGPDPLTQRFLAGDRFVHLDAINDYYRSGNRYARALADLGGGRSLLSVPLWRNGVLLGFFIVYWRELRGVDNRQITLLENFAAQAAIAIENARLLGELQQRTGDLTESLEYQTATSGVLKVISRSTFDLQPVLDTLVETAARLCDAEMGHIAKREGDVYRVAATFAFTPEWDVGARRLTFEPGRGSVVARTLLARDAVQIADLAAYPEYALPDVIAIGKMRTALGVPLLREGEPIGVIYLARQRVESFTDRQIELVRTFADQAVIAIENARLITETREALERQTATAEVLQVINASPGDLAPVFDAILQKAHSLCEATHGALVTYDGEQFRAIATHGLPLAAVEILRRPRGAGPSSGPRARLVHGERFVQIADLADPASPPESPELRSVVELTGLRAVLFVPLRKEGGLLGYITAYRDEARPFSEKQISLLENFAAQAVIAMENARLITETREALEQQTATAEVLQVINSSPGDLAPVFDAILEKAARLCDANLGIFWRHSGGLFHAATVHGPAEFADFLRRNPQRPPPGSDLWRLLHGEDVVYKTDHAEGPSANPRLNDAFLRLGGGRAGVIVALRTDSGVLGAIRIFRQDVRPFTDKQIALLQNFAAQAVIAIENARLIAETQEALDQQTATAEVLQVINSSPGDLAPVFGAMLDKATHLCEADIGWLLTYHENTFRFAAGWTLPKPFEDYLRHMDQPRSNEANTGLAAGLPFVHVVDMKDAVYDSGSPFRRAVVDLGDVRTGLAVSLRKDGKLLGTFNLARKEVRPFTDKQIALVQNFAAQAVIAIENARLLTEQREALEQQTATAEVLRVISGSATDLQPVFEAITARAAKLCEAEFSAVARFENGLLHLVAVSNLLPDEARAFHSLFPRPPTRGFVMGRAFVEGRTVHIEDVLADPDYDPRTREILQSLTGYRSFFGVPILRDGKPIGVIGCARRAVKPFTAAQIELVSTFADQAVIAIENARLFNDLRERTDELAQRQAELRVTFDNMADGVVMFDEELRLAAWNRNFQQIVDLPEDFLGAPQSYTDYIRYLAKRGEFGEVDPEAEIRRLRERFGDHYSFERIRPDGRVIEVRHNPVPSGGFVLIYSDITERKRSEAEIRAARDAAEEASRTIAAAYQELKTAQARLIQAEKMASLGQLTAGIAHEIKNPLNFVNNFAGLSVELLDELKETAAPALAALDGDKLAEVDEIVAMLTGNLEKIAEHGRRADGIVKSMLEHSRGESGERRAVDLNNLVEEALNLSYHGARAQDQSFNITLERDFAAAIAPIELVPQDVTRVLLNLIGNGFYAATKRLKDGAEPNFRPALRLTTHDLGEGVEIRVRDNGAGIMPEIRDKLFQPFFTTKPTGEGTGLGLSISWDIVTQQHGGTIAVDSRVGEYTEFAIHLPRTRATTTQAMVTSEAAAARMTA